MLTNHLKVPCPSMNYFIVEFLAILDVRDVRKIPKESIVVKTAYHLSDAHDIISSLARILKTMKESDLSILR